MPCSRVPELALAHTGCSRWSRPAGTFLARLSPDPRVPSHRLAEVREVFAEGTAQLPPEIIETYLVRDTRDPALFRLTTVWRIREALERIRASRVKPKGVQMFEAVGAAPRLSVFEVVVHRSS